MLRRRMPNHIMKLINLGTYNIWQPQKHDNLPETIEQLAALWGSRWSMMGMVKSQWTSYLVKVQTILQVAISYNKQLVLIGYIWVLGIYSHASGPGLLILFSHASHCMSIHHWARGFGIKLRFIDGATRLRGMARSLDVAQVLTSIKKVELKIEDGVCIAAWLAVYRSTLMWRTALGYTVVWFKEASSTKPARIYACRIP